MKKIAIYVSFVFASIADAALFITSDSYIQLIVAIILYLPLAYFAFKLFPRKPRLESATAEIPANYNIQKDVQEDHAPSEGGESKEIELFDIDKRVFLKLIGATGLSFFITSLFTRRLDPLLGTSEVKGPISIKDPSDNVINPAKHHPTDNYKISEVDYGINTYYGFIDQTEGWFIMKEDMNAGTYRYIKGNTNFHEHWDNRENLKYDLFNRIFPIS